LLSVNVSSSGTALLSFRVRGKTVDIFKIHLPLVLWVFFYNLT
jgi:hypothetical protein